MKICHVLSNDISRDGGTEIAVKNIKQNYDVKSIGTAGPLLYVKSFFMAIRLIFSDYDILHFHDMAGYGYTFVPKFMRKKIVLSCHGLWETYFYEIKDMSISQKIISYFLKNAQKRLIKKADIIVATSRFRQKKIKFLYGIDSELIQNGIDINIFKPMKMKKIFDFIWVGTNPNKGLKFAIKTAKKYNGKLLVIGIDGRKMKNVYYINHVPHNDMPFFYNKSKTLINYSLISRYDFVVLEAMACGLNVILNKESVEELLQKKIYKKNIVLIRGKLGRKIAKKNSWSESIKKYNDIYIRIMMM